MKAALYECGFHVHFYAYSRNYISLTPSTKAFSLRERLG
jgi:hypothetical protein